MHSSPNQPYLSLHLMLHSYWLWPLHLPTVRLCLLLWFTSQLVLSADFLKTEDNFIPLHEYCTEAVSRTLPRIVRRYVRTFTQLGFSFFIFIFVFLGGRTLELRDPGSGILHRINFRFINTALSCRITMKFIEFTLRTHPSEGLFNTIRAPSERRKN